MLEERQTTIRQDIITLLNETPASVRDISQAVGIREKEVFNHLVNVEKSLKHLKKNLQLAPYKCMNCDFTFTNRKKYTKPGKCPNCKKSRIVPAVFRIV